MSEDKTFDKLRRVPLHEMLVILRESKSPVARPVLQLGGTVIEQSSLYMQLMRNYNWIQILKENGWDYHEFLLEVEKDTLKNHIDTYNDSIEFPEGLIEHAKEFFPNIKFTPAKIEFE